MPDEPGIYGILGEFKSAEALVAAAQRAKDAGYADLDAFTPFPVEELNDILGLHDDRVLWLGLTGGFFGAGVALAMQAYVNFSYPLDVGGRAQYAWSAFAVVTFELTVLFAALFPAFGMLALNGLPKLCHPIFNAPNFGRASKDRFFLCIGARDPTFDAVKVADFMRTLKADAVERVPE